MFSQLLKGQIKKKKKKKNKSYIWEVRIDLFWSWFQTSYLVTAGSEIFYLINIIDFCFLKFWQTEKASVLNPV